jgi:hypothetical protein
MLNHSDTTDQLTALPAVHGNEIFIDHIKLMHFGPPARFILNYPADFPLVWDGLRCNTN